MASMTILNATPKGHDATNAHHAETMWTSVLPLEPIKDDLWRILDLLTPNELESLVRAAVAEAKVILDKHKGTFDSSISNQEMMRLFPSSFDAGSRGRSRQ